MNNRNEENFKNAIKTLVREEPEKLTYFNGVDKGGEIPQFFPNRKKVSNVGRRRLYSISMAAAAACIVVFAGVAAYSFSTDTFYHNPAEKDDGASVKIALPADDRESVGDFKAKTDDAVDGSAAGIDDENLNTRTKDDAAASYTLQGSGAIPFVPLIIAIAAAAVFVLLFIKRKRLTL